LQDRALAVERQVIAIFAHHRIDDHSITGETLLNNPSRRYRARHTLFFTPFARALFALDDPHKVPGRFDIQLFALLVADDNLLPSAATANKVCGG
jgi:hypothetical protein